jgi:hypothetical protein
MDELQEIQRLAIEIDANIRNGFAELRKTFDRLDASFVTANELLGDIRGELKRIVR